MTSDEIAAKFALDMAQRTRDADADSYLSAASFVYGGFERYLVGKAAAIERRIDELYGHSTQPASPGAATLADPASTGESAAGT